MTTQTTLLIIPKSNTTRVHASIEEYKGKQRFDIRTYYLAGNDWLPTQKGVAIDMEQVPLLIEALQKVQALTSQVEESAA